LSTLYIRPTPGLLFPAFSISNRCLTFFNSALPVLDISAVGVDDMIGLGLSWDLLLLRLKGSPLSFEKKSVFFLGSFSAWLVLSMVDKYLSSGTELYCYIF